MSAPLSQPDPCAAAALAFRRFFDELREVYLEREALFTQLELALLCREHVLVIGPPGTAKSEIAGAVLSRIVDEHTGSPSLFARQLAESTVQTDLVGPVDFKVLTETGRTVYITDDGMLGATYAFLDEVFDGRDMLLRSILNILHERELKHGKRLTAGKLDCAIMTSNRYLSEVVARAPELLQAFADRLSFICFVPRSFARPTSRAAMLARSVRGQRPALRCRLSLQQLELLQRAVEQVQISSRILEGLEVLADELERSLQQQAARLPDYTPTKSFSQRSMVKALWALKAAVVRDRIYRHPDRPLEAAEPDLGALRHFFLLGGPLAGEVEALLKAAVEPRERAQLEIVRGEQRAFEEALGKAGEQLATGVEREAAALKAGDDLAAADALARGYQGGLASALASTLRGKLVPGPRHPQNRQALLAVARGLLSTTEQRLSRGMAGEGDGRAGISLLSSLAEVLALCHAVPELAPGASRLAAGIGDYCSQALEMMGLSAEGAEFDGAIRLEGLTGMATGIGEELSRIRELRAAMVAVDPAQAEALREREQAARARVIASLRRRAAHVAQLPADRKVDPHEWLVQGCRQMAHLERALAALGVAPDGLRAELLGPLGRAYVREVLSTAPFSRLEQLGRAVQGVIESLRREGIPLQPALADGRELLEARLRPHAEALAKDAAPPARAPAALDGEAYLAYRGELQAATALEGELQALIALEGQLSAVLDGAAVGFAAVKEVVAGAELSALEIKVGFLRAWLTRLLSELPAPEKLSSRGEAEGAFDRLVKSRFPMLAMKEGELIKLEGALLALARITGGEGGKAGRLLEVLRGAGAEFHAFSKRLLEVRASL